MNLNPNIDVPLAAPVLLLAMALLLNAFLLVRRHRGRSPGAALDAPAESMDALLIEIARSMEELKGQLSHQREELAGLLSDAAGEPHPAALPAYAAAQAAEARATATAGGDLQRVVEQLVTEGLSDRAIARRMRIGLEEVRIARVRPGRAS